jgi:hypothetical protein
VESFQVVLERSESNNYTQKGVASRSAVSIRHAFAINTIDENTSRTSSTPKFHGVANVDRIALVKEIRAHRAIPRRTVKMTDRNTTERTINVSHLFAFQIHV